MSEKLEKLSFFQANAPIYFMSKVFGQVPFSINKTSTRKSISKFTVPGIAFSLICFGVFLALVYYFSNVQVPQNYPDITQLGHYMHIVVGFTVATVCFVLSFTKASKLCAFINELQELDESMFDLCDTVQINYRQTLKFHFKLTFISLVMFGFIGGFDFFVFQGLYGGMTGFIIVAYVLPFIFSGCTAGQFIIGVHLIYQRFVMINKFLNIIADTNEPTSMAVKMHRALFEDVDKPAGKLKETFTVNRSVAARKSGQSGEGGLGTISKSVSLTSFNEFGSTKKLTSEKGDQGDKSYFQHFKSIFSCDCLSLCSRKVSEQVPVDLPLNLHLRMNEIFAMHDKLADVAEDLNDLYSTEMVVFITGGFVMVLFGVFFETKVIFWPQGVNTKLLLFATSYVLWGVALSAIIYTVLRACSNSREESCESALIIHKILQNKPAFMINDDAYHGKMKSFTLQILHRKKVFNFHGLGLFKLDYTFIFSAVSAATSYLIVLLQFDMTADFQRFIASMNKTLS